MSHGFSRIKTIESILATHATDIAGNTASVGTLTSSVGANTTNIAGNTAAVGNIPTPGAGDVEGDEVVLDSTNHMVFQKPLSYQYKVSNTEDRINYQNIAAVQDGGTPKEITQLTLAITPRSTNSKIKLHGSVCGTWYQRSYARGIIIGRTVVGQAEEFIRAAVPVDTSGNPLNSKTRLLAAWLGDSHHFNRLSPANLNFLYIDDPQTTSAITYKVYLINTHPGTLGDFYLNGTSSNSNDAQEEVAISTFIAQEI